MLNNEVKFHPLYPHISKATVIRAREHKFQCWVQRSYNRRKPYFTTENYKARATITIIIKMNAPNFCLKHFAQDYSCYFANPCKILHKFVFAIWSGAGVTNSRQKRELPVGPRLSAISPLQSTDRHYIRSLHISCYTSNLKTKGIHLFCVYSIWFLLCRTFKVSVATWCSKRSCGLRREAFHYCSLETDYLMWNISKVGSSSLQWLQFSGGDIGSISISSFSGTSCPSYHNISILKINFVSFLWFCLKP